MTYLNWAPKVVFLEISALDMQIISYMHMMFKLTNNFNKQKSALCICLRIIFDLIHMRIIHYSIIRAIYLSISKSSIYVDDVSLSTNRSN